MQGDGAEDSAPAAALVGDVDPSSLQDINFDDGAHNPHIISIRD